MQIQTNSLDGALKSIEPQNDMEDKQMLIDLIVGNSGNSPGYIVILGDNLDGAATQQIARIIAMSCQLIWQNVLD